jgi:hypothetical protein
VLKWVVFHGNCQPFVVRIHRRTFRDRPRLQDSVDFHAKIIVEVRGVVFVNNKLPYSHDKQLAYNNVSTTLGRTAITLIDKQYVTRGKTNTRKLETRNIGGYPKNTEASPAL